MGRAPLLRMARARAKSFLPARRRLSQNRAYMSVACACQLDIGCPRTRQEFVASALLRRTASRASTRGIAIGCVAQARRGRKCESLVRFRALASSRSGAGISADLVLLARTIALGVRLTPDRRRRHSRRFAERVRSRVRFDVYHPHVHAPQRVEIQLGALDLPRARLPTRPGTVDDDNIAPALYMSERPRSPAPEETNSMTIDAPDALARGPARTSALARARSWCVARVSRGRHS